MRSHNQGQAGFVNRAWESEKVSGNAISNTFYRKSYSSFRKVNCNGEFGDAAD